MIKCGAFDSLGSSRAALMAVLDNAVAAGIAAAKDKANGQMNLFDDFSSDEPKKKTAQPMPKVDPWDTKVQCGYEKEVLGFYMSAHPMDAFRERITLMQTSTIADAMNFPDRTNAILCGMISSTKIASVREPKPGRPSIFASFDLEDFASAIRCNAWPETYEKISELIKNDTIVACVGRIDKHAGTDNANFTINDIYNIEEIDDRYVRSIEIRVSELIHGENIIADLSDILNAYPGDKPMILHPM